MASTSAAAGQRPAAAAAPAAKAARVAPAAPSALPLAPPWAAVAAQRQCSRTALLPKS